MQLELLDQHRWDSREQLARAVFEWIDAWSRYAGDPPAVRAAGSAWVMWLSCRAWSAPIEVLAVT